MIFGFIVWVVACRTPSQRPNFTDEMPFFAVTIRWAAAKHTVNGSFVEWKIVPTVSEVCFLQPTDRSIVPPSESRLISSSIKIQCWKYLQYLMCYALSLR